MSSKATLCLFAYGLGELEVHVIFLRRAISGAHEVECSRADAIELQSLPMTINRVLGART